jgi:hypothetical protein
MEARQTSFKIIESVIVDQKFIVVAQLISGEIECNSIFISKDTGKKFKVKGVGFIPHETYAEGKRAITLNQCNDKSGNELKVGEILYCYNSQ